MSTFAEFERLDSEQNECKTAIYTTMQTNALNYRTDYNSTNRRCFRDSDQEFQLWTNQYTNRFYTCADCDRKAAPVQAPFPMEVPKGKGFREVTKDKQVLYRDC